MRIIKTVAGVVIASLLVAAMFWVVKDCSDRGGVYAKAWPAPYYQCMGATG